MGPGDVAKRATLHLRFPIYPGGKCVANVFQRPLGNPAEGRDGVGPGGGGDDDAVTHRPCFSGRICRISASMSSTGLTFPDRMSSMDA